MLVRAGESNAAQTGEETGEQQVSRNSRPDSDRVLPMVAGGGVFRAIRNERELSLFHLRDRV